MLSVKPLMSDLSSQELSASFFLETILVPLSSLGLLVAIGVKGFAFGDNGTKEAVAWFKSLLTYFDLVPEFSNLPVGVDKGWYSDRLPS